MSETALERCKRQFKEIGSPTYKMAADEIERLTQELAQVKEQLAALEPVGWIQEHTAGVGFFQGDLDPREVHDNGKPCYRVYRMAQERRRNRGT